MFIHLIILIMMSRFSYNNPIAISTKEPFKRSILKAHYRLHPLVDPILDNSVEPTKDNLVDLRFDPSINSQTKLPLAVTSDFTTDNKADDKTDPSVDPISIDTNNDKKGPVNDPSNDHSDDPVPDDIANENTDRSVDSSSDDIAEDNTDPISDDINDAVVTDSSYDPPNDSSVDPNEKAEDKTNTSVDPTSDDAAEDDIDSSADPTYDDVTDDVTDDEADLPTDSISDDTVDDKKDPNDTSVTDHPHDPSIDPLIGSTSDTSTADLTSNPTTSTHAIVNYEADENVGRDATTFYKFFGENRNRMETKYKKKPRLELKAIDFLDEDTSKIKPKMLDSMYGGSKIKEKKSDGNYFKKVTSYSKMNFKTTNFPVNISDEINKIRTELNPFMAIRNGDNYDNIDAEWVRPRIKPNTDTIDKNEILNNNAGYRRAPKLPELPKFPNIKIPKLPPKIPHKKRILAMLALLRSTYRGIPGMDGVPGFPEIGPVPGLPGPLKNIRGVQVLEFLETVAGNAWSTMKKIWLPKCDTQCRSID